MNKIFSSFVLFAMIFSLVLGTLPNVASATYGGYGGGHGDYPDHDDDDDKEDLCLNIPGIQETVPDGKERTEDGNCVYPEPEPEPTTATIVATKIVCENESDLPNWGAGGPNITSSTADNFLAGHPNCHQEDWTFEWASASTGNPGDNDGEAGGEWESFDESVTIDAPSDPTYVWVREVMQNGYVEFSGDTTSRTDDVSAEFYCHVDVLNYDNYDRVDNMQAGKTYYCIGFNAEVADEDDCEETIPTGTVDAGNAVLNVAEGSCPVKVSFSSYSHAGTIVPFEDQILIENITDTYGPGTHNIGPVELACNWQTDLYLGDVQEHLVPNVGHTGLIAYDYVQNQTCDPANSAPTADAGPDQTITLPISSVTLDGSGSTDSDGTISSYVWSFVSGPTTVDPTDTVSTTASPLVVGTYVFKLTVTDDDGATGEDTVSITVNPEVIIQNPACSDGLDNDGDNLIDVNDPGCHTDRNVNNPDSYVPTDDDETNPNTECSDGIDNTDPEDSLVDSNDPGCHTDDDAGNPSSWNPEDTSEVDEDGTGGGGDEPQCSDDIDNDSDGEIDYPADPGCDNSSDDDEKDEDDNSSRSSGGSRRKTTGQVLGAETTCGIYVEKYLRVGYDNDVESVKKVQAFLNSYMSAGLAEDGIYGKHTEAAVKAFQLARNPNVLAPWGLTEATGIFYLTTQTEVNNIMCPDLGLPIPSNLVNFSSSSQVPAPIPGYVLGTSTGFYK